MAVLLKYNLDFIKNLLVQLAQSTEDDRESVERTLRVRGSFLRGLFFSIFTILIV